VELSRIVKLYVEYSASLSMHSNSLTPLLKSIAKRVSSGVMLQVLYELWPNLSKENTKVGQSDEGVNCTSLTNQQEDVHGLIGYFNVLKWSLKAAPRPDVLEHLREIFKVFIEAFDVQLTFSSNEVGFQFIENMSLCNSLPVRVETMPYLLSRSL